MTPLPRVALVTDSNSQIPPALVVRYRVLVVPITVVIDGVAHAEGVDLDADAFYERFEHGRTPEVSTSQPSPAAFARAYARAAQSGAEQILSVHIGSQVSGALNSAKIAAAESSIPVRLVDSGTASFGITCCLWEAAEALVKGVDVEEAAAIAEHTAAKVGNVFVVRAVELARRGGRVNLAEDAAAGDAVPVLTFLGGTAEVIATARSVDDAASAMARHVLAHGDRLRVAVGYADAAGAPLSDALQQQVTSAANVAEVVRYRVGPSVGVHTGPGTAGAFMFSTTER